MGHHRRHSKDSLRCLQGAAEWDTVILARRVEIRPSNKPEGVTAVVRSGPHLLGLELPSSAREVCASARKEARGGTMGDSGDRACCRDDKKDIWLEPGENLWRQAVGKRP